jgi:hypothetical protein
VVKITTTGSCNFNSVGVINADGGNAVKGGGGAGGTINMKCASFNGASLAAAVLNASGGNGTTIGGGGGGGRIALISTGGVGSFTGGWSLPGDNTALTTWANRIKTNGGVAAGTLGRGGAGTIFVKYSGINNGLLLIRDSTTAGNYTDATMGDTYLVSLAGTVGTTAGSVMPITVTAGNMSAAHASRYIGMQVRPDLSYTNSTPSNWSDDDVMSVTANDASSLTLSGAVNSIPSGALMRSIDVLDYFIIDGANIVRTVGDIYTINAQYGTITSSGMVDMVNTAAGIGGGSYPVAIASGTMTLNSVNLNVGSLTLSSTALLTASGKGYLGLTGGNPEGYMGNTGGTIGSNTASGGSHGGRGGAISGAGIVYGDYRWPKYPGGGGAGNTGAHGGGVINITSAGACNLNGTSNITADGVVGTGTWGGGAGGSIYMKCSAIGGNTTSVMSASGAAGGGTGGSGGGGGRIALISTGNSSSFTGTYIWPSNSANLTTFKTKVKAIGGTGTYVGGAGTIYLSSSSNTNGYLIIDNGKASYNAGNDGVTELTSTTANSNVLNALNSGSQAKITAAATPFANMINLFAGYSLDIFPTPGVSADNSPFHSSHKNGMISENATNTITVSGTPFISETVSNNYVYRIVHKLDAIDLGGYAQVNINGGDLIITPTAGAGCDLHSGTVNKLDVPTGSKLSGNSLASQSCLDAQVTTKGTTVNFTNYYFQ